MVTDRSIALLHLLPSYVIQGIVIQGETIWKEAPRIEYSFRSLPIEAKGFSHISQNQTKGDKQEHQNLGKFVKNKVPKNYKIAWNIVITIKI